MESRSRFDSFNRFDGTVFRARARKSRHMALRDFCMPVVKGIPAATDAGNKKKMIMASWLETVLQHPDAAARLIAITATALMGIILALGVAIQLIGPVSLQFPRIEIPSVGLRIGEAHSEPGESTTYLRSIRTAPIHSAISDESGRFNKHQPEK